MRRVIKPIVSIILVFSILCTMLFGFNAIAFAQSSVVYTGVNTGAEDGSADKPYNNFTDALANVADGGTIYIKGGTYSFVNDIGNDEPLVIDKAVTITTEPNADSRGAISTRSAGIVLGADVTFSNIDIGLASAYHNAICANGYSLTLDNVGKYTGHRIANVFAGGMASADGTPYIESGDHASVTISGTNSEYDGIFAGGLNCGYDGDVEINITGDSNMKLGASYSCGAVEAYVDRNDWFNFANPSAPTPYNNFATNNVVWNINQGKSKSISGLGANTSTVNYYANPNARESTVSFDKITNLNILSGVVEPVSIANVSNISIAENCTLDIQNTNEFSCNNFSSNGKLVLSKDGLINITGAVSGTTAFETANGYGGMSGIVNDEHTYINAPNSKADSFTFAPNYGQEDYTLDFDNGLWTTHSNYVPADELVSSIAFDETEMEFTESEIANYFCSIPVTIESVEDEDASYYDYTYTVKVNGKEYVSLPDEDYLGVAYIEELNMEFYMYADDFDTCITYAFIELGPRGDDVLAGNYEITISNGDAKDTMLLTVNHEYEDGICSFCGAKEVEELDFSAFDSAYAYATSIDRTGYTKLSLDSLDKTLVDKSILSTQDDIDFATEKIETAITNLVKVDCNVVFDIVIDDDITEYKYTYKYGEIAYFDASDYKDYDVYKWTLETDNSTALIRTSSKIFNSVVYADSNYVVYLTRNRSLEDDGLVKRTYLSKNGFVVAIQYEDKNNEPNYPDAPIVPFYNHIGWIADGNTYKAMYEVKANDAELCQIIAKNDILLSSDDMNVSSKSELNVPYDSVVTISSKPLGNIALSTDGTEAGIITYLDNNSSFHCPMTKKIYVILVDEASVKIGVTGNYAKYENSKDVVGVNAQYYLPAGCSFIECGAIYTANGKDVKLPSSVQNKNHEFTTELIAPLSSLASISARAYLNYYDENGDMQTIESDSVAINLVR